MRRVLSVTSQASPYKKTEQKSDGGCLPTGSRTQPVCKGYKVNLDVAVLAPSFIIPNCLILHPDVTPITLAGVQSDAFPISLLRLFLQSETEHHRVLLHDMSDSVYPPLSVTSHMMGRLRISSDGEASAWWNGIVGVPEPGWCDQAVGKTEERSLS